MANWPYVKIGDVCTVERGGSPRPIDKFITDDPNGINWIKIGDTNDSMYITSTAQKIISEGMKKSRYVQPGDFLLSNSMSFGRPYILKIDGCIHDGWLVLRDNKNTFDKRFLYYYLSSPSTYRKFENMAVGGVVNNLNSEMVRGVSVPVPPMNEQLEIVGILEQVTALISLRKQQIAKLDELVKARFVEMFGDPVANPNGWDEFALCDVCSKLTDGTHFSPESYTSGEYRYITAKNIKPDGFDFTNITYVNSDVHNEIYARCNPEYGDVLYIKDGVTTGIAMINTLHEPFTMLSSVALLKQNRSIIDGCYLCGVLNNRHMYDSIRSDMGGAAITRLTITKLNKIIIPVPPLALQHQFAVFAAQIDKQKLTIQHSLAKLEFLKKALMQKYFG